MKLDGDDELIFVDSFQALKSECSELIFTDDDYLIDAEGWRYIVSDSLQVTCTNKRLTLDEVTELIRANEFSKAGLCLTKIHFLSIEDAIMSLCLNRL